jgi:hypothetical protein
MGRSLALFLFVCCALQAQQRPESSELPSKPFFITKNWVIGGEGAWDQLTMDARFGWLFITHGHQVQVVDTETGAILSKIDGLDEAHSVVLDDTGEFGYIGDAKAQSVAVFDQRLMQTTKFFKIEGKPRLLVFDVSEKLLFVLHFPVPLPNRIIQNRNAAGNLHTVSIPDTRPPSQWERDTTITIIDTQRQAVIGQMLFSGNLDAAVSDGEGHIFINVMDQAHVLRIDTSSVANLLHSLAGESGATLDYRGVFIRGAARLTWAAPIRPDIFQVYSTCRNPRALAVDSRLERLFVACENMKLTIWNLGHGELVDSVPLKDVPDALAYDADRGLLYAASGNGSLTVVRRHVTDSYSVVQDLPTRAQARTLALNPINGEIYLVANQLGFDLNQPTGFGKAKVIPIQGSFQVLVVGN